MDKKELEKKEKELADRADEKIMGYYLELEYLVSDQGQVKEVSRERKDLFVI